MGIGGGRNDLVPSICIKAARGKRSELRWCFLIPVNDSFSDGRKSHSRGNEPFALLRSGLLRRRPTKDLSGTIGPGLYTPSISIQEVCEESGSQAKTHLSRRFTTIAIAKVLERATVPGKLGHHHKQSNGYSLVAKDARRRGGKTHVEPIFANAH